MTHDDSRQRRPELIRDQFRAPRAREGRDFGSVVIPIRRDTTGIPTVLMLKVKACTVTRSQKKTDVDSRNQARFYSAPPTAKI